MAALRTRILQLRLRPKEAAAWKAEAKRADLTLSELIRETMKARLDTVKKRKLKAA